MIWPDIRIIIIKIIIGSRIAKIKYTGFNLNYINSERMQCRRRRRNFGLFKVRSKTKRTRYATLY